MVPDENSMEDPLCNSSFGSMVSLDYVTPDTESAQPCRQLTVNGFTDGWSPDEWNDGWSFAMNGMMTGRPLDGTKIGSKRMTLPQAYFHCEVWILVQR